MQFNLATLPAGVFIGGNPKLTVLFTEVIAIAEQLSPSVGGATQPNTVYIDLSAARETVIDRASWDLGFYSAGDEFRVILNPHVAALAQGLNKTDMNNVGEPDSSGFGATMNFRSFHPLATTWTDDPSGDLTKTAIAEISATDADNKVYILNRGQDANGAPRGWKKIRILQSGGNYILQHADIAATSFSDVTISKNSDFNFTFFSFEDGEVEVEPKKDRWDLAISVHHAFVNFGFMIPYLQKDMVFQNRAGGAIVMLKESEHGAYEDFSVSGLTGIALSTDQLAIGSSWRDVFGPAVHDDRFYIVQDHDGNQYKLRFDRITLNGERGFPQFSYELLNN